MEPQLEGCGKLGAAGRRQPSKNASMEPQLEGCGKFGVLFVIGIGVGLQWSRNLRVAESDSTVDAFSDGGQLQWSRNLRVAESVGVAGGRQ